MKILKEILNYSFLKNNQSCHNFNLTMKNSFFLLKLLILGLGIYAFQGCIPKDKEVLVDEDPIGPTPPGEPTPPDEPTPPGETMPPGDTTRTVDSTDEKNVLTGTILDSKKKPISGVKVKIKGKRQTVFTNQKGVYRIKGNKADLLEITPPNGKTSLYKSGIIILPTYSPPPGIEEELVVETSPSGGISLPPTDPPTVDPQDPPVVVIRDPVLQIGANDYIKLSKDKVDQNSYNYTIEKRTNGQIVKSGQIDDKLYFIDLGLVNEVQYVIKIETPGGKKMAYFSLLNGKLDPKCTVIKSKP